MQSEGLSEVQSVLFIKIHELETLRASHQKLIDTHTRLKAQQLDKEKVCMCNIILLVAMYITKLIAHNNECI